MSGGAEIAGAGKAGFQVERLAFFSDAIFAIAITLLALEIHPAGPYPNSERGMQAALLTMVPKIIGFVVSFAVVGTYWRAHHRLFRWVRDSNAKLVSINMRLLLTVSFIPCPTAFFSSHPAFRTSLFFYTAALALVGLAHYSLCRYVARHSLLLDPRTPMFDLRLAARRSLIIPVACLVADALSFVTLWLAGLALVAIPVAISAYTRLAYRRVERRKWRETKARLPETEQARKADSE